MLFILIKSISVGTSLWQGRYKSYYIVNESYLFTLYKYIEHNPIQAKISEFVGQYEFTLLATLPENNLAVIECAKHSQLIELLKEDGILEHLQLSLNNDELQKLQEEQTRKIVIEEHELKLHKQKNLEEHFNAVNNKEKRNIAIVNALTDGYTQASIAKYLNVSTSTISKAVKKSL
ncbi:MAG: helix-turn-helix domain-containing protein [Sulfurimonas sp.]|nr:helix-turn-helix domain-containing protein [Sulfurimonas sp.]